jgi:hypothetical protein
MRLTLEREEWDRMNHRLETTHMQDLASRFVEYKSRHGLWSTCKRAGLSLKRILTGNRMVLFYCDLGAREATSPCTTSPLAVERNTAAQMVAERDMLKIVNFWNPKIMPRLISERFNRGASLWLAKSGDGLAGYGWTLNGGTIEPHFFPLGTDDVHLFDFFVFPEFRGQRVNCFLVLKILDVLAGEKKNRAYIEVAEWNLPQLKSLSKMPFQKLGRARKFRLFGRIFTVWSEGNTTRSPASSKSTASDQSA